MKEITGNIWDFYNPKRGHWVVITTNGNIRKDGAAVMGRGIAREAAKRFPRLAIQLAHAIKHADYLRLYEWQEYCLITLPTKHNWWEKSDMELIRANVASLHYGYFSSNAFKGKIYLPRLGCGSGRLSWKDVKPVLEGYLNDRFIVVDRDT